MNLQEFSVYFDAMCKRFSVEKDPIIGMAYFKALEHLSASQWVQIATWALTTQKYLPSPMELINSLAPSTDSIWTDLLNKSQQLSAVRYDTDKFRRLDRQLKSELSPNVALFLAENKLSLLSLGDRSESDLKYLKRNLGSYLVNKFSPETVTHILPTGTTIYPNNQNGHLAERN